MRDFDLQPIIDQVKRLHEPRTITVTATDGAKAEVLLLPKEEGIEAHDITKLIDAQRDRPKRRLGTAQLYDLASFIDYSNRYRDPHSALFAVNDPAQPSLTCVFDHHQALRLVDGFARKDAEGFEHPTTYKPDTTDPSPRFGTHRALYRLPLSDEWKAWKDRDGKMMAQRDFAEFLEDRIVDVLDPLRVQNLSVQDGEGGRLTLDEVKSLLGGSFADPKKLMELSRGLKVAAQVAAGQVVNLSTGEIDMAYREEHFEASAADGGQRKLQVPGLFFIGIPVFKLGVRYALPVRLRYRVAGGSVMWAYEIWRADKALEAAIAEAGAKAREGTGLPLYLGQPEQVSA